VRFGNGFECYRQRRKAQCQALINRITVEIDTNLEMLSYQKGVKVLGRNIGNPDYNRVFDETAKRIYEVVTRRACPESVKVM
jgi:hypothetical protein